MSARTKQPAKDQTAPEYSYSVFRQVEAKLRDQIEGGRWSGGVMLPSRRALAEEFGVAVGTIQQAMASLVSLGVLRTEGTRGTFVAQASPASDQQSTGDRTDISISPAISAPTNVMTLGIILDLPAHKDDLLQVDNMFFRPMMRALEEFCLEAGAEICAFNLHRGDRPRLGVREAVDSLIADGVKALGFLMLGDEIGAEEVLSCVDIEQMPVIYTSIGPGHPALPHIYYDIASAGYQAAQHLLRQGYRDILFLTPYSDDWVDIRIAAARDAVRHAGLPADTLRVAPETRKVVPKIKGGEPFKSASQEVMREYCRTGRKHVGIIAANDHSAHGVLDAAAEAGWKPGRDFGLIGFDDINDSLTRGLTTLRPPLEAMGRETGRLLLQAIQGKKPPMQVCLRSHLIPRATTRPYHGD